MGSVSTGLKTVLATYGADRCVPCSLKEYLQTSKSNRWLHVFSHSELYHELTVFVKHGGTMALKDTIASIRRARDLTQDEMAEQLHVTRQAVSRWENGDTTPGLDLLKLIATTFDVSIAEILELPEGNRCESCGMPLADAAFLGTEADGSLSKRFCKWCYQNGGYVNPDMTMEEMLDVCVSHMAAPDSGYTEESAREYMEMLLPTCERWKK